MWCGSDGDDDGENEYATLFDGVDGGIVVYYSDDNGYSVYVMVMKMMCLLWCVRGLS